MRYILENDQSYSYGGTRTEEEYNSLDEAVERYLSIRKGFVTLIEVHDDGKRRLVQDAAGRKYAKGSPYYNFPHVPHVSIVDGKEIETT